MKQILGINVQNSNAKESLTGCHSSETLPDDGYISLDLETNDSTIGSATDWLSDDRSANPEDLAAIGQEADNSPEVERFVTDLLPEREAPETNLNPTLFQPTLFQL